MPERSSASGSASVLIYRPAGHKNAVVPPESALGHEGASGSGTTTDVKLIKAATWDRLEEEHNLAKVRSRS